MSFYPEDVIENVHSAFEYFYKCAAPPVTTTSAVVAAATTRLADALEMACSYLCIIDEEASRTFEKDVFVNLVSKMLVFFCDSPQQLDRIDLTVLTIRALANFCEMIPMGSLVAANAPGRLLPLLAQYLWRKTLLLESGALAEELLRCMSLLALSCHTPLVRLGVADGLAALDPLLCDARRRLLCLTALKHLLLAAGPEDAAAVTPAVLAALATAREHCRAVFHLPATAAFPESSPVVVPDDELTMLLNYLEVAALAADRILCTAEQLASSRGLGLAERIADVALTCLRQSVRVQGGSGRQLRLPACSPFVSFYMVSPTFAVPFFIKTQVYGVVCHVCLKLLSGTKDALQGMQSSRGSVGAAGPAAAGNVGGGGARGSGGLDGSPSAVVSVSATPPQRSRNVSGDMELAPASSSLSSSSSSQTGEVAAVTGAAEGGNNTGSRNARAARGSNNSNNSNHNSNRAGSTTRETVDANEAMTALAQRLLSDDINDVPLISEEMQVIPLLEFLLTIVPPTPAAYTCFDHQNITVPYFPWRWEDDFHNRYDCGEALSRRVERQYGNFRHSRTEPVRRVTHGMDKQLYVDVLNQQFVNTTAMYPHAFLRSPLLHGYSHEHATGFFRGCRCCAVTPKQEARVRKLLAERRAEPKTKTRGSRLAATPALSVTSTSFSATDRSTPCRSPGLSSLAGGGGGGGGGSPESTGLNRSLSNLIAEAATVTAGGGVSDSATDWHTPRDARQSPATPSPSVHTSLFPSAPAASTPREGAILSVGAAAAPAPRGGGGAEGNSRSNGGSGRSGWWCCGGGGDDVVVSPVARPRGVIPTGGILAAPSSRAREAPPPSVDARAPLLGDRKAVKAPPLHELLADRAEYVEAGEAAAEVYRREEVLRRLVPLLLPALETVIKYSVNPVVARHCAVLVLRVLAAAADCVALPHTLISNSLTRVRESRSRRTAASTGGGGGGRPRCSLLNEMLYRLTPSLSSTLAYLLLAGRSERTPVLGVHYPLRAACLNDPVAEGVVSIGLSPNFGCSTVSVGGTVQLAAVEGMALLVEFNEFYARHNGGGGLHSSTPSRQADASLSLPDSRARPGVRSVFASSQQRRVIAAAVIQLANQVSSECGVMPLVSLANERTTFAASLALCPKDGCAYHLSLAEAKAAAVRSLARLEQLLRMERLRVREGVLVDAQRSNLSVLTDDTPPRPAAPQPALPGPRGAAGAARNPLAYPTEESPQVSQDGCVLKVLPVDDDRPGASGGRAAGVIAAAGDGDADGGPEDALADLYEEVLAIVGSGDKENPPTRPFTSSPADRAGKQPPSPPAPRASTSVYTNGVPVTVRPALMLCAYLQASPDDITAVVHSAPELLSLVAGQLEAYLAPIVQRQEYLYIDGGRAVTDGDDDGWLRRHSGADALPVACLTTLQTLWEELTRAVGEHMGVARSELFSYALLSRQPARIHKRLKKNKGTVVAEQCIWAPVFVELVEMHESSSAAADSPLGSGDSDARVSTNPNESDISVNPPPARLGSGGSSGSSATHGHGGERRVRVLGEWLPCAAVEILLQRTMVLPFTTVASLSAVIAASVRVCVHKKTGRIAYATVADDTAAAADADTDSASALSDERQPELYVQPQHPGEARDEPLAMAEYDITALPSTQVLLFINGTPLLTPQMSLMDALCAYEGTGNLLCGADTAPLALKEVRTAAFWGLAHTVHYAILTAPLPVALFARVETPCCCLYDAPGAATARRYSVSSVGGSGGPARAAQPLSEKRVSGLFSATPQSVCCSPAHCFRKTAAKGGKKTVEVDVGGDAALRLLAVLTTLLRLDAGTNPDLRNSSEQRRLSSSLIHDIYSQLNLFMFPALLGSPACELAIADHPSSYALWNYPVIFPFDMRLALLRLFLSYRRASLSTRVMRSAQRQRLIPLWSHYHGFEWLPNDDAVSTNKRLKVLVRRDRVLHDGARVLRRFAWCPLHLDVCFDGEPGIGLGPSLELFELLAAELCRAERGMWRADDDGAVSHPLFPSPDLPPSALAHFETLGLLVGRLLLIGRPIALRFHPLFLRRLRGDSLLADGDSSSSSSSCNSAASRNLALVDPELEHSLQLLETLPAAELEAAALTFVYNGRGGAAWDPALTPGGASLPVTLANVHAYAAAVRRRVLHEVPDTALRFFRAGVSTALNPVYFQLFSPNELSFILSGAMGRLWASAAEFRRDVRASHGYTMQSQEVVDLVEIVPRWSARRQRDFLRFVTGSTCLPLGGLHTPITIVRRELELNGDAGTDGSSPTATAAEGTTLRTRLGSESFAGAGRLRQDLPTVSTCFNYLKLPHYPTRENLEERLLTAITEGQGCFMLT